MEARIRTALTPEFLLIENQSASHKGHSGDDGSGESHYRITINCSKLTGKSRLAQHRHVFDVLGKDIVQKTHSISINIK